MRFHKKIVFLGFLIIVFLNCFSQEHNYPQQWQAKWIWSEKSNDEGWPIIYARKEFDLSKLPSNAVVHISAHLLFKAYINGKFIGEGPPRNIAPDISYCSFPLDTVLRKGENSIVIEAYSTAPRHIGGLIVQLETYDKHDKLINVIGTDSTWRVIPAPWQRVNIPGVGYGHSEVFKADKDFEQRHNCGYDDSGWEQAKEVNMLIRRKDKTEIPWSDPIAGILRDGMQGDFPFKNPEPSILPHYQRTPVRAKEIVRAAEVLEIHGDNYHDMRDNPGLQMTTEIPRPLEHCSISDLTGLLMGENNPTVINNFGYPGDIKSYYEYLETEKEVPAVYNSTLILDFGEIINAYVSLDLEGNNGAIVDIAWGQTLIDGRVLPIPFSSIKKNGMTAARYHLREGRQQWETFHWQNFRYLQVTFRKLNAPLTVYQIQAVKSGQPLIQKGEFDCSDPFMKKLFDAGKNTLELASYDVFMDNTNREKKIWGGDISDGSIATCLPIFGDIPMLQNYLDLFCKGQRDDGSLPNYASAGGSISSHILAHPIRTAYWMAEYGFWCKDTVKYTRKILPTLKNYVLYLNNRSQSNGLLKLKEKEHWYVDQVADSSGFLPPCGDIPTSPNLFYALLLDKASNVFKAYGDTVFGEICRDQSNLVRNTISREFWNEKQGLYANGIESASGEKRGNLSEHANYLALLNGLGKNERRETVLNSLSDPDRTGDIIQCGPPFILWPIAALFEIGEEDLALEFMRDRYSRFFLEGGNTFWEEWSYLAASNSWRGRFRSMAQNGAGSPAWTFHTEILGVKPLLPGFKEFQIAPRLCGLEWAKGEIPSPAGNIKISWEMKNGIYSLSVLVPDDTKAIVKIPFVSQDITVNNKKVTGNEITIWPGEHIIKAQKL